MTEQTVTKSAETDEHGMARHTWKRRGLIAAAWAAVAAIVARRTTEPVEAGMDGDVVLGAPNTTTGTTTIVNTTANGDGLDAICNAGTDGLGLFAVGSGYGVYSFNTGGTSGGSGFTAVRAGRTTPASGATRLRVSACSARA